MTDNPITASVTALAEQAEELHVRAMTVDKKLVSHEGDTAALGEEFTKLCDAENHAREQAIMAPARNWGEIGVKLELVLLHAGVLPHAIRPDDLGDSKSIEHMLAEGIRQVLRDTARLSVG